MTKEEFYEKFLSEFRKYFHYQTEISIKEAKKDHKKTDIVVVNYS